MKDYYLTDAFSDHAVRYVNEHAKEQPGKPFFKRRVAQQQTRSDAADI
ncbi:MAG: hypothetical protein ACREH8_04630 [Opitutaceae bacterium]